MKSSRRARAASWAASLTAAVLVAAAVGTLSAGAAAEEDGEAVFAQLCRGCHTIGGGKLTGPDLAGLADRRERAWVERFISDPQAVIDSGDPIAVELLDEFGAPMPALGVSDAQLAALVEFLGFASQEPEPAPPTTPEPTPPTGPETPLTGEAATGKRLFEGSERFAGGGPPCLSCHSVAGVGALGGGQLGPDLTGAFAKYGGAQGLDGVLEAVAFPTMAPIFRDRQLTAEERADLVAFLREAADDDRPGRQVGWLVALGVGGALLLALLAAVVWRRRLYGVRRTLVDHATGRTR